MPRKFGTSVRGMRPVVELMRRSAARVSALPWDRALMRRQQAFRWSARLLPALLLPLFLAACAKPVQETGGNVSKGKDLIARYGCAACHVIPGIDGSVGQKGPSLAGVAVRPKIAGGLDNNPENLIRWIREPRKVDRYTEMTELGISVEEAQDIAAFLYTLK